MKKTAVKILIVFLFVAIPYILFVSPSFAQTTTPGNSQQEAAQYLTPNTAPNVPNNLHTWTQNIMIEVMAALTCQLTGIDPTNPNGQCLGIDPSSGKIGYVQGNGGAIGGMGNLIAMTYTPPFHVSDYTQDLAANFGIVKQAHAQTGIGFQGLNPLIKLWTVMRNIVYLLFVVVFIVTGFAIMLRVKIDPRTAMSIENQIPKIIVGLILVSFSFALVGLMVDLTYLIIYIVMNTFSDPNLLCSAASNCASVTKGVQEAQQNMQGSNPFGMFNNIVDGKNMVTSAAGGVKDTVQSLLYSGTNYNPENPNSIPVLTGIGNFFWAIGHPQDTLRDAFVWILGVIVGMVALLVIAIAILVALFRLWFELLKAYIYILIHTVLAPFWMLGGLIPGSPISFDGWLREMISNFSVFPVTVGMFLMGRIFQESIGHGADNVFILPMIGNPNTAAFGNLIGMGIVLITPQVVTMMKDLLKAPPFKYSASVGQMLGIGGGYPATVARGIGSTIVSGREFTPGAGGAYHQRGLPRAFLNRILGRG